MNGNARCSIDDGEECYVEETIESTGRKMRAVNKLMVGEKSTQRPPLNHQDRIAQDSAPLWRKIDSTSWPYS